MPQKKQNLASFMAVGADAADPTTYGKFQILRLPDTTQVPGPSQIANQFSNDPKVAEAVRPFKQADAKIEYGNLLTLPVGGGLLYVQPLYTTAPERCGQLPGAAVRADLVRPRRRHRADAGPVAGRRPHLG